MNRALATCDERPGPQASHVPASDASLTVELRSDISLRAEDVASLDSLIDGRPSVGVFLSKAWLSGLFDEPPEGFEPALVLLREAGALRGIVPIGVRHTLTHARVNLLGGGLGSDRIDLLAARGFEARAADTFLGWLRETFGRRAFVLELGDVPADSSLWGAIHRAGIERTLRLALQPREVHTLPYLDLTDSWPPAAAGAPRSRNSRSIDKHRRWLERRGRLRVEMLEDPGDVMKAFDLLRRLLHHRWRDQPGGSVLDNPRTLRFHQRAQ